MKPKCFSGLWWLKPEASVNMRAEGYRVFKEFLILSTPYICANALTVRAVSTYKKLKHNQN